MADKEKLAELFLEIGEWLELKGDNPFKIRAYESAARVFEQLEEDPAALARSGKLEELPGVGKAIAAKALEFFETGRIAYHDELRSSIPAVLFELVKIPGLGAKKARLIHEKLGVQSVGELEYASKADSFLTPEKKHRMANLLHFEETQPHFLSWRVKDLPCASAYLSRLLGNLPVMTWTVRNPEDRAKAEKHADQMVFEGFLP